MFYKLYFEGIHKKNSPRVFLNKIDKDKNIIK